MLERRCPHNLTPFLHKMKYINGIFRLETPSISLKNVEKAYEKARTKHIICTGC